MTGIILRRALTALPVLLGVVTISFFLLAFVPGDPVDVMLGEQASSADKAALRHQLELDLPTGERYSLYLEKLSHFDFGSSLNDRQPISPVLVKRLRATFELALTAIALAMLFGIPLGIVAAIRRDRWIDHALRVMSLIGTSAPSFWLGPALVFLFALKLDLLPVSERGGLDHVILPAVTLAIGLTAVLLQITRASMLEVLREDYIRTAKAKGASNTKIFFGHALLNAATPVVSVLALQAGAVMTGTILVETIFDWPGLGTMIYQAIQRRDFPVVQACVLTIATITMVVQLLADLALTVIDPRVRPS